MKKDLVIQKEGLSLVFNQTKMTHNQIANFFGVSVETVKQQYSTNAKGLKKMYDKAISSGKKVNGYTSTQLEEMYKRYENLAQ